MRPLTGSDGSKPVKRRGHAKQGEKMRKAMFRDQGGVCVCLSLSWEDSIEWVERAYQYEFVAWVN